MGELMLIEIALCPLHAQTEALREALEHCLAVFRSMADRGAYPRELLPDTTEYLGKQGSIFVVKALAATKETT